MKENDKNIKNRINDTLEDGTVVSLQGVGMKFNLSKEKVDSLKEYFIKFMKNLSPAETKAGSDFVSIVTISGLVTRAARPFNLKNILSHHFPLLR